MYSIKFLLAKLLQRLNISEIRDSSLHQNARISPGCIFKNSTIGKWSYTAPKTSVLHTDIGNFVSIAANCSIGLAAHPMDWASLSPVFHEGRNIFLKNFSTHKFVPYKRTKIGHDVWIGEKVIIVGGVHIGNGAVIGAGSIVTKDIPPYHIYAGNPAHCIRARFDKEIIEKLLELNFYEWSDDRIKQIAPYMNDVEKLLSFVELSNP